MILINAAATVYELQQVQERLEESLIHQGEALAASVTGPLVQAVWDFDSVQMIKLADGLLTTDAVAVVSVLDQDGSEQFLRALEDYEPETADVVQSYPLIHTSRTETHNIGTLVLTLNYNEVRNALREALIWRATMTGTVAVLIAAISSIFLVGVSRPLVAMAGIIPRIGTKDFSGNLPGLSRRDELGSVAKALQSLQNSTDELNRLREAENEEVRQDRRRIYHAVEATHDGILIIGLDGKLTYRNQAATELLGGLEIGNSISFSNHFDAEAAEALAASVTGEQEMVLAASTVATGKLHHLMIRGRVIRDLDDTELGYSLVVHDQTAHVLQAKETKHVSEHDSLTGIPNRRLFEQTLAQYVDEAAHEVAVMIADLDNFKRVNDTFGHPVGDALIQHAADVISSAVGETELVARLGGDEFAIISRNRDPVGTLSCIAHDLASRFAEPQEVDQLVLTTGVSMGIAKAVTASNGSQDVMRRADLALYEAKRKGRSRFEIFEGDLETRLNRKAELEKDLKKAIAEGQISVDYQMQTDARTGQIVACEALARWTHEHYDRISPVEFIPIAEEANLIEDLTIQVLTDVCKNARHLEELGFEGRIAVNFSANLFGAGLPELIDDVLLVSGCSPTSIEAEITESVLLSPVPQARSDIGRLRDKGITVALDDFGMGYSSLSYLQQFPVDKIKIDRSFTQQICLRPETEAIIKAICEMGHALGMCVTAEGVEEAEQLAKLQDAGVDTFQGFIDGRPLKVDQLLDRLRASHAQAKTSTC